MNEGMIKSKKHMIIGSIMTLLVLTVIGVVWFMQMPSNAFTIDVNPSIEIVTNRLDKVVEVNPLNEDAALLLADYEIKDHEITVVINDLVDHMILSGHIVGGEDNVVMITVKDNELNESYVKKANEAIAAHLETKQMAYTILNQEIDDQEINTSEISDGKSAMINKMIKKNDSLNFDVLAQMSLQELMIVSEGLNISSDDIYDKKMNSSAKKSDDVSHVIEIDEAAATLLALEKIGGGEIKKIETDDGNYEIEILFNGYKYELKLDGRTGEIIKYKVESDDDDAAIEITKEQASATALEKVGGGEIKEIEVDDGKYEIEIYYNGNEYKVEVHGLTGEIMKFKVESDDDDDDAAVEITKEQAIATALEKVGGGEIKEIEVDDGKYEIEIYYNGNEYKVEVHGLTGEIMKFEMKSDDDDDDAAIEITKEQASATALEKVGGGEIKEIKVDDGKYEIEIYYNGNEYKLEVHGLTGEIMKFKVESDDDDDDDAAVEITKEQAIATALEKVGGGEIKEIEVDDGKYEIEIYYNGNEYKLEVHGLTGEIMKFEMESDDDDDDAAIEITEKQASATALEKVGGGEIKEIKVDDGKYEIEIYYNGNEYKVEVHGLTGEIMKFETESDDDDDAAIEITKEQASAIALEKVGGGEIKEIEVDDGKYEIEIYYNDNEYKLEIHGLTGEILDYEEKSDD